MGFFFDKLNLTSIKEAEVDGQEIEDNQHNTDYTEDDQTQQSNNTEEDNPNQEQNPGEADQNANQGEEPPPDNMGGEEETTDYTAEGGDDGYGGDNGNNAPPPQDNEEQPVDDIKKQEEELYANLTPEQLDIKHKELKSQYLSLYDIVVTLIDRIGDAAISEENIGVAEYISNNLSSMRDMLADYMSDVYKGKSYIENSINYNRFLAVLNGINKILEELDKKEDK